MQNLAIAAFEKQGRFGFDSRGSYREEDKLLRQAYAEAQKLADDEYIDGETGLITCRKCKSPRQHYIDKYFGWMHLDCKCLEQVHQAVNKANRLKALANALRKEAFAEYAAGTEYTFFNDDQANKIASTYARNYCADFAEMKAAGRGIMFWGDTGNGKTFIATAVMNELIDQGHMVRFVKVSEMVRAMNNYVTSPTALDKYKSCAAIVLDDLGAEDGKPQNLEAITRFLDFAEENRICLIITTNLSATDFYSAAELGFKRVSDRIVANCDLIQLRGGSRRQAKSRERQKDLRECYAEF